MNIDSSEERIPFSAGDWVIDKNNPGQPGQYTGKWHKAGPHIMVKLAHPGGGMSTRPLACLEAVGDNIRGSIEDRLTDGHFGKLRDLQRLVTYEKLKGALHEVIYSMEAAQIDFYPYQFKPVLKFINSPTERLIIADEVGLGKTIESALIWIELQARRQANRLLVVCPRILVDKWREEMRSKFLLDARVVEFQELKREIDYLKAEGPGHPFVLIATYTGLRPPRDELRLLDEPLGQQIESSPKTDLMRELRHWPEGFEPFDLVIFDEAHYMRNPGTTTFHLGETLAAAAGAVLCVSATPVNNSNTDLHSLVRLTDEDFFETQGLFEELLEVNRPTVQAMNALSRTPVDISLLEAVLDQMRGSRFISESPLFKRFVEKVEHLDVSDKAQLIQCQDLAEKLNLLGNYINRTRRVQVKENRPLRDPVVLNVEYSHEEMALYQAILQVVRAECRRDNRPFHVFRILGLQLRAASCLPVIAQEIRDGRFGEPGELFAEAMDDEVLDSFSEQDLEQEMSNEEFVELLDYDFERNDSKYRELLRMLIEFVPDEKVIIFAFYRPTLAYLRRRLATDGISVTVIHGGILNEVRWEQIDRFRDPHGPRILLSSEVGSEGIDLQFCRVMVNYDLPWNPMRVEQRIGRIDRVGQEAEKLSIVNFKVRGTIEERLYDRLHAKLERFANSLGDLESIIGKEIQNLTVELLSKELSPEQESILMEQSEQVIENHLLQIQALEESGDALIAFSDYVQSKIEEGREKGRYILPGELEDYLSDFFGREFQGCEINYNTPSGGCLRIRLNSDAQFSLADFIRDDRSLSARPFRQGEFTITFRREVHQRLSLRQKRSVHFVNHLSPLIRWITHINQENEHAFFNVSALIIDEPTLKEGDYCYRIERWKLKGLSERETLAYGIEPLNNEVRPTVDECETIIQNVLRKARDWDYVDCNRNSLIRAHKKLEDDLAKRFSSAFDEFDAENQTNYQIKVQRVTSIFDRRIAQDQQRLRTLNEAGRDPRVIRATEGRLQAGIKNKEKRLHELEHKANVDMETAEVAAGVFRVIRA